MNHSSDAIKIADFEFSRRLRNGAQAQSPRMVVYQTANLCAEAVAAAIHKHTQWDVVCATTQFDEATAAARRCQADALLFDVPNGLAAAVAVLIRNLRKECPGVPLVLLTEHAGVGFRRAVSAARLAAIIDKRDPIDMMQATLRSIEQKRHRRAVLMGGGNGARPGACRALKSGESSSLEVGPAADPALKFA